MLQLTINQLPEATQYPYIIVLKNDTSRYVNVFGFLLSTGSAVLFAREMLFRNMVIMPYLLGIIFIAGLLTWNAFIYYKTDRDIYYSKALLIAGLVWTRMPYFQWLVAVFAFLALLEYQAKKPVEIGFAEDHIMLNKLFRKKIAWSEITNVVLKDGVITIDFKNNRLLQREIDKGENEASEQEFNDWVSKIKK
ncbi:MAG: hypothetical protein JNK79_09310 [Chitinophagaceae bacterium]|nr:hypothetical protein [Chitinophagaceae bacterium]